MNAEDFRDWWSYHLGCFPSLARWATEETPAVWYDTFLHPLELLDCRTASATMRVDRYDGYFSTHPEEVVRRVRLAEQQRQQDERERLARLAERRAEKEQTHDAAAKTHAEKEGVGPKCRSCLDSCTIRARPIGSKHEFRAVTCIYCKAGRIFFDRQHHPNSQRGRDFGRRFGGMVRFDPRTLEVDPKIGYLIPEQRSPAGKEWSPGMDTSAAFTIGDDSDEF